MPKSLSQDISPQQQLSQLRKLLGESVIGQSKAVDEVMSVIERERAGLHDYKKPVGTFLFLGPTGVGKTWLAEELARLTMPPEAFIRLDCSEYSLEHEVAKIFGAPPGYQGVELGSQLTNRITAIKHEPNEPPAFILLLDEIEKAHPRFFDVWLQVFDSGRLTDGKGNILNFGHALIFITSNVGASNFMENADLGFRPARPSENSLSAAVSRELKRTFRPEFLNRLSSVVEFTPLNREQQERIFDQMILDLNMRLAHLEVRVEINAELREKIFKAGFSKEYGARELRRAILKMVENPLARNLINGSIQRDTNILLGHIQEELSYITTGQYPLLMQEASITRT